MKTTLTLEITHIDPDDEKTWPPEDNKIIWVGYYDIPDAVYKTQRYGRYLLANRDWGMKHNTAQVSDFHYWFQTPSIPTPSEKEKTK